MRNLRLAFRTLFRTPLVTGVAVLSLALGIGANAAIYSLFHELLLAPLPVPHPEQLVVFGGNTPTPGSHQTTLAGGQIFRPTGQPPLCRWDDGTRGTDFRTYRSA